MDTVEQVLRELSTKELAAVFDVITKLPKSKESAAALSSTMELLENLSPDGFSNWLKQTNGASMRNYF